MFIRSLCRNDDYDINKEKNVLRSDLLIVLKRTAPDYILKNPNINDKDFSL